MWNHITSWTSLNWGENSFSSWQSWVIVGLCFVESVSTPVNLAKSSQVWVGSRTNNSQIKKHNTSNLGYKNCLTYIWIWQGRYTRKQSAPRGESWNLRWCVCWHLPDFCPRMKKFKTLSEKWCMKLPETSGLNRWKRGGEEMRDERRKERRDQCLKEEINPQLSFLRRLKIEDERKSRSEWEERRKKVVEEDLTLMNPKQPKGVFTAAAGESVCVFAI